MGSGEVENRLWEEYHREGDMSARQRLIEIYAPLVKYVLGRIAPLAPSTIEADDLLGYGSIGLIQAIDRFDPERGIKFSTYAVSRIRGAILDGIRTSDQLPRSYRQKERFVREGFQRAANQLGRSPTDEELAAELNVKGEELQQLLQDTRCGSILSFDEVFTSWGEGGFGKAVESKEPGPIEGVLRAEIRQVLIEAIGKLSEKERLVISLYYYDGLTLREIAEVLGLSESRVSQLHSKAVLRLRGRLGSRKRELLG